MSDVADVLVSAISSSICLPNPEGFVDPIAQDPACWPRRRRWELFSPSRGAFL